MIREVAVMSLIVGCAIVSGNYYAEYSDNVAMEIMECAANNEYRSHLDFNGDGKLTVVDAVNVAKRYHDNLENGNTLQVNAEIIYDIATENYSDDLIYYEIYSVNGENCREYDMEISDVTEISVWLEFENYGESLEIQVDPFREVIEVLS